MQVNRDFAPTATALALARRLIARDAVPRGVDDAEAKGAALQRACEHVTENLCDSMGEAGCTALLARALVRTEGDHPALKSLRHVNEGSLQLDGVVQAVETHGLDQVTTAVEALLAALTDLLIRLIGDDMAVTLIDREAPGKRRISGANGVQP